MPSGKTGAAVGMSESTWIVVPCFNEAARLKPGTFGSFMSDDNSPNFLFMDDGSTDRTLDVLNDLQRSYGPRCRVVSLDRNVGKAEAVRTGLNLSLAHGAARVGYWDADLSTPLQAIAEFGQVLDNRPRVELVMGSRVRLLGHRIERSGIRHLVGRVYSTLASLALTLPVYDTQCGAKLFRRTGALQAALSEPFRTGWAFDVDLILRLQKLWEDDGLDRIVEIPLPLWIDNGESKVSPLSGARAFLHLLTLLGKSRVTGSERKRSASRNRNDAPSPAAHIGLPRLGARGGGGNTPDPSDGGVGQ